MSVTRLVLPDGTRALRKRHAAAVGAVGEAAGLAALAAAPDGPPVPAVLAVEGDSLLLSDLGDGAADDAAWERFARQLAAVHGCTGPGFGFAVTTCCGPTPQPNAWLADGHDFVAEQRLLHLVRACRAVDAVSASCLADVERLCARLRELVPRMPPVLLHGDLWQGNAHPAADGRIHLIDPACWYGWAECDLAMTRLFGGFPPCFYAAYVEARPPPAGWERRLELHNLYHLLNHALLFRGAYGGQAATVARRWA